MKQIVGKSGKELIVMTQVKKNIENRIMITIVKGYDGAVLSGNL